MLVNSHREGFPKPGEQPAYYSMLANIVELTHKSETELLAVVTPTGEVPGGVVYFSDMVYYGSAVRPQRKRMPPGRG